MMRLLIALLVLCTANISSAGMQVPRKLVVATAGGDWFTAWSITPNAEATDGATRHWRNVIPASTSSYDGTSVRITVKAGSGASAGQIGGMSIGQSTSGYSYDSTPTRVTFGGSDTTSVSTGTEAVSDVISFSFDKSKRHLITIYTPARNFVTKTGAASNSLYYSSSYGTGDSSMDLTPDGTYSSANEFAGAIKLEVYQ